MDMSTLRTQGYQYLSFFTEGLNFQMFLLWLLPLLNSFPCFLSGTTFDFSSTKVKRKETKDWERKNLSCLWTLYPDSDIFIPTPYLQDIILCGAISFLPCLNLCLQVSKKERGLVDVLAHKCPLSRARNLAFKSLPCRSQAHPPPCAPNTFITPHHHQMLTFSISLPSSYSLDLTFSPQTPTYPSFLPH